MKTSASFQSLSDGHEFSCENNARFLSSHCFSTKIVYISFNKHQQCPRVLLNSWRTANYCSQSVDVAAFVKTKTKNKIAQKSLTYNVRSNSNCRKVDVVFTPFYLREMSCEQRTGVKSGITRKTLFVCTR